MEYRFRRVVRAAVVASAAAGVMIFGAGIASAHVTVDPSTTAAGAYAVLAFSIPHGCDGSATTQVAIKIPDGVTSVTPTVNPNWTIEKKMETLATPIDDGHGGQVTERVDQVVYTAVTPLPADMRDVFELSVKLPDTAGERLVFPAVQTCEVGETAWIETAADGQPEPDHPAPFVTLTAATAGGHGGGVAAEAADAMPSESVAAERGTSVVAWIALGLGIAGLLLGGVAVTRRSSKS